MTKEEFIQAYADAYRKYALSCQKTQMREIKKFHSKVGNLTRQVENNAIPKQPELRRHIAVYYAYAMKYDNAPLLKSIKKCVRICAKQDYGIYVQNGYGEDFLEYLFKSPATVVKGMALQEKYDMFLKRIIREQVLEKVKSDPTAEYIETRAMERHFCLHIGDTNSGKTYSSLERLKEAKCGVYLSPLRLLALEIYDRMTAAGVLCSMLTGEEHIDIPGSSVISETVEMADLSAEYDIAVIDEAQMLADEFRGHSWVRALMGLKCREIHVCASRDAEHILKEIIEKCGDTWEVVYHERKTALLLQDDIFPLQDEHFGLYVQPGDAYIVFSKRAVLDLAARMEMQGVRASVIYGHLPPEIRKNEVRKFVEHETEVVISTDAIGMGLNLPIRRIIFAEISKFDGTQSRNLNVTEIKQIAGRAGRYGIYDRGYVAATSAHGLQLLRQALEHDAPEITHARLAFPKVLLDIEKPLDDILRMWASLPDEFPYKKIEVKEMLTLYDTLSHYSNHFEALPEGEDKAAILNMISCPMDAGNREIVRQWCRYCLSYTAGPSLDFPNLAYVRAKTELEQWETYYRLLDLYHNFSLRMGKIINETKFAEEKDRADENIIRILAKSKTGYVKCCRICGKMLPVDSRSTLCDSCYADMERSRGRRYGMRRR